MWTRRRRSDEDFLEELDSHVALEMQRLVSEEGMSFKDARARALRSFGNVTKTRERFYESHRVQLLDDLRRDVIYALRSFCRNPAFACIAVVTLALGIGANAAIFSVVNAVLLMPLPYREPDRLVRLKEVIPASAARDGRERQSGGITVAEMRELRARARTVSHVAFGGGPVLMTFSGKGEAVRLQGQRVSPGIFTTLGVPPLMGRGFGAAQEQPGADAAVVLSYAAWHRYFDGDRDVIGQTRTLADTLTSNSLPRPYAIVGVMPESFEFPDRQIEFWIPIPWRPAARGAMMARLSDGASPSAAAAEVGAILREMRKSKPEVRYELVPESERSSIKDLKPSLLVLMAAAGLVLLIACANVANLLFARTTARQREMAVRLALGAGRGRLIRHMLTESVVLALFGGILGSVLTVGSVRLLKTLATTLARMDLGVQLAFPRLEEIAVDPFVLIFVLAISGAAGILFGLAPAIPHSRPAQMAALRETAPAYSGFGLSHRGRSGTLVVAAEISMAMVLLVGAGLLMHSFLKLSQVDPGYDANNVLTFQVALPSDRYPLPQLRTFAGNLTDRLRSVPGVQAAAYGQLPMVAITESALFRRTPEVPKSLPEGSPERRLVSKDYLEVMGIRIVAGRGFTDRDRPGQPRVLLINEVLARREFPGENPIGRHVYAGSDSEPWEIVGVVADVRQTGIEEEPGPQVFAEYSQWPGETVFVLGPYFSVRTHSDPLSVVPHVREVARQLDPEAGLFNVATMDQLVANRISRPRMYTVLLAIFAIVAVLLAAIGVYGVVAYSVTRRTREIGIRMALGARRSEVIALVLRQSILAIGIGLVAGLAGAAAATRYLEGMLFGVAPLDSLTFAAVTLLFLIVASTAAFMPARRATRINPVTALRHE